MLKVTLRSILSLFCGFLLFWVLLSLNPSQPINIYLIGCCVSFAVVLFFYLKKQEIVLLPKAKVVVLSKGESAEFQIDNVRVKLEPQWSKIKDGQLSLKGSVIWQNYPVKEHPEPDVIGFPVNYICSGEEETIDWIRSYTSSGELYPYVLSVNCEAGPEPSKLAVALVRGEALKR
jgi:hypothetical protein